jgi:hypothetical protein
MRIVVSDTSCLIDLRKGGLLRAMFALPYRFAMPNTLFEDELLSLGNPEKQELLDLGLEVVDLPGEAVQRAGRHFNQNPRLTLNDCFALVLAERTPDCILLTGDGPLRRIAASKEIEVHGVLWTIDEMETHGAVGLQALYDALRLFDDDKLVFLPKDEVRRRLRRLARKR